MESRGASAGASLHANGTGVSRMQLPQLAFFASSAPFRGQFPPFGFTLKTVMGTTEYTEHAEAEADGNARAFTCWVNSL